MKSTAPMRVMRDIGHLQWVADYWGHYSRRSLGFHGSALWLDRGFDFAAGGTVMDRGDHFGFFGRSLEGFLGMTVHRSTAVWTMHPVSPIPTARFLFRIEELAPSR